MYTEFFNLRELPFQVTPDPRFFFANPAAETAFANLLYGIQQRKGFIVVTGEVGTGKTTLLRRLIDVMVADTPFVLLFNPRLDFDEMLTFACDELGVRPSGPQRVRKFQALNRFFMNQLRRGGTTALLVDEAQDLPDEVLEDLRLLSNLETSGEKLLQIVLVGQPELDEKLRHPRLRQLRQRVSIYARLDCLRPREVEGFIRHRLDVAGATGDFPFTPEALVAIVRASRGVPRLINQICDGCLLSCYASSVRTVTREIVDEVVGDLGLNEERTDPRATVSVLDQALGRVGETAKRLEATGGLPVRPGASPVPHAPGRASSGGPDIRKSLAGLLGNLSQAPSAATRWRSGGTRRPETTTAGAGAFLLVLLLLGIAVLIAARTGASPSSDEEAAEAAALRRETTRELPTVPGTDLRGGDPLPSSRHGATGQDPSAAATRDESAPAAGSASRSKSRARTASGDGVRVVSRRRGPIAAAPLDDGPPGPPAPFGPAPALVGYGSLGPSQTEETRESLTGILDGDTFGKTAGRVIP